MSKKNHSTKRHEKSKSKKEEISKLKKDVKHEFGKGKVESFDKLVKENKASGKSWYNGFEGKWWWGMTEEKVRARLVEVEQILEKIKPDINKDSKSETNTDINKDSKSETNTDINKDSKSETNTDINKDSKSETNTDINKDSKSEISSILDSQVAIDIGHGLGNRAPELIKNIIESFDKENTTDISNIKFDAKEDEPKTNKDDRFEINSVIDKK